MTASNDILNLTDDEKVRSAMVWMINELREILTFEDGKLPDTGEKSGILWRTCGDGVQFHARPSWDDMKEDQS